MTPTTPMTPMTPITGCERTSLYLDGELPTEDEAAALAHIAECRSCQAELGDWVGFETALSRSRSAHAPEVAQRGTLAGPHRLVDRSAQRRRRWRVGAAAVSIAAVAAIAILWLGRDRSHGSEAVAIALGDTRPLEARFTAPGFDRHRPYRVERGAPVGAVVPLDVLVELERRGDRARLAAAHALSGDLARAAAALESMPPSAARDSDRAAVALAGDPIRALQLADAAIAAAPDLLPAHWNRALALRKLELPLAAAAELDVVASRGERGWADEARMTAAVLRAPMARRMTDLQRFHQARDAMIAGTGAPLDDDAVRGHPGMARRALLDALAVVGSADEARALGPIAAELDRLTGNTDAARMVAAVSERELSVRQRFRTPYRALVAGNLDAAARTQLVTDLEQGGAAVADLLVGALLRTPPSEAGVARLRRAIAPGDAWLGLQLVRLDAALKLAAGDRSGAERALLAAGPACRDRAWTLVCGDIDLDLDALYLPMRRLDEADARLRSARAAYVLEGRPDLEDYVLRMVANLERLRDRDRLAAAYLQEIRLRARDATEAQRCEATRFASESLAAIALAAGDVPGARGLIAEPVACGKLPTTLWLIDAVAVARLGNADDRARATALIAAARGAAGSRAVAAEIGEGRLRIDADPAAGAAQIRAGFAALAALGAEPGTAGELRGWGFASLISDAGRRSDWSGALALFAEELGAGVPAGCVVAASADDERATAVVRGRDGVLRGSHQPARPLGPLGADSIVPPALATALTGCDTVAVIARPPLHGRADLLPASLPWAFVGAADGTRSQASPARRHVIVADPRPPATMGLPPLAPVADPGATVVTGSAATPTRVLRELADAEYIEIHAHGVVDARDAAFLALSPDSDGSFTLTAAQVREARFTGAPIVVLAACRSATTARYEAFRWSLPDAFLAAGARAVIASATAIPDDQGADLFAELRARIDRGEPPAQAVAALRAARVAAGQRWAAGLMVFE